VAVVSGMNSPIAQERCGACEGRFREVFAMRRQRMRRAERTGFAEHDFKVCELCGALNPAANHECVVCGWRGRFENEPAAVQRSIQDWRAQMAASNDPYWSEDADLAEYLGPDDRPANRLLVWLKRVFGRG